MLTECGYTVDSRPGYFDLCTRSVHLTNYRKDVYVLFYNEPITLDRFPVLPRLPYFQHVAYRFSIDRYRSAARHAAWYGEPPTWNPFRKVRLRSQYQIGADEEAGLRRGVGHSETCLTPTVETDRMKQTEKDYPSPVHANTMPPGSAGTTGPSSGSRLDHPGHDSTPGTSDTVLADDGNDNHPRKRKKGLLARFGKKNKEDEVERTTTAGSKKNKQKFTFVGQLKATLFNSWINILLVAVPVGIALNYAHVNPVIIFVVNFIAIIPLAGMLSYATEEIALRTGETIGGLLNASFGSV